MASRTVKAGLDIGYGTLDGVCTNSDGSKKPFTFNMPSLVSESMADEFEVEGSVLRKRNIERVPVNDRFYNVGEDAGDTIKELNDDYIHSDHYMALFLAGLQRFKQKRIDHLVTGLPVFQYTKLHEQLKAKLEGTHRIQNGQSVEVRQVSVVPQPLGSLIEHCVRKNVSNPRSLNVVVVDPGHYSFDWLVIRNGAAVLAQSGSLNEGVGHVLNVISELIAVERDGDSPSHTKIDAALQTRDQIVTMYGKPIRLKPYLNKAMQIQSDKAIRKMKNAIKNFQDIDTFILTGGGAELYAPYIKKHFAKHNIDVLTDALMANAQGYFKHADRKR